jgi:very-short-patch-repair endonuclease
MRTATLQIVVGADDELLEPDEAAIPALDYVPYDPATADERHTDDWLQTMLPAERLDHSLRRIDEQARATLEEQGVNTLFLALGMLRFRESKDSETWFRAPLVLVPVELARRSARAGYTLKAGDDEALVNPALIEYLRGTFGVVLPSLPDSGAIADDYDFQEFLKAATLAIAGQEGWTIQTDMFLALFSFQKLVMFKDLETHEPAIGAHRLVYQLLTRGGGASYGLPEEIRELSLDAAFPPEQAFQVVDADSSQMRAAAAVARQLDLVIEGPPGTGKSQTITNLVAQALAAGKTVLFVAEKMAALDVVHRRLVGAGLGEFCLELHSSKANKRKVMQDLSAALDASLVPLAGAKEAASRLPRVRTQLADYVRAVHEPFGALAKSPYAVAGQLGPLLTAPRMSLEIDVVKVDAEALDEAQRALKDLVTHAGAVGAPATHPWRGAARTLYTEDDLDRIFRVAQSASEQAATLQSAIAQVAEEFGVPPAARLAEVRTLLELADVMVASPGVSTAVLLDEGWNAAPAPATDLIARVRAYRSLYDTVATKLQSEVFDGDHADDVSYVERKSSGLFSFLSFLDGRFRAIRRRWLSYRREGYAPALIDQASDMKQVGLLAQQRRELVSKREIGAALFGGHWHGETSDTTRLQSYVEYVLRFRRLAMARGLTKRAAAVASTVSPDVSALRSLVRDADNLAESLVTLQEAGQWSRGFLLDGSVAETQRRVTEIRESIDKAPAWAAFEASRRRAITTAAAGAVAAAMTGQQAFDQVPRAFPRAFYMQWMSAAVQARPALKAFDTLSHQNTIAEFRELDQRVLRENRTTLVGRLRERAQQALRSPEAGSALVRLRREMVKQRRIAPLRRTLRDCDAAVRAIKPCWLMSPLTVAQYVGADAPSFDLIIFDEASQLPTEDAVGAIVRGRQLVVVGDPKQLPPTDFFSVSSGAVVATIGDDGAPLYEDTESVLEEFMGAAVPMSRLKWHYRSAHESLVTFSNINFYDAQLHTFPSIATGTDDSGLQFQFVEGGTYEGKGINLVEARRVADDVVEFAKLQLQARAAGQTSHSLGVGTLNLRQQMAILDELEIRRRNGPAIEPFFDRSGPEPFFVKNLENIQGDERDAIFLSITYGKGIDGRLRYNFGPLNRENGWRRLNVLITRARRQMRVFSSIRDHDINPAGATSDGPRLLREFLAYAEHRRLESSRAVALGDAESPFEQDVCQELMNRGVQVQSQVGACGYRIDIGVRDPDVPGRFVCGIECDGMAYHSLETVRDRDRLRQQVLEDRGWTIHRVWSTDWFKDRKGQIDRLMKAIEQSRTQAKVEDQQAQEERLVEARVSAVEAPPATPPAPEPAEYKRALAPQYVAHQFKIAPSGELLDARPEVLVEMVVAVVNHEGPVHETDLIGRICDAWDTSAGSRIKGAIQAAASAAARQKRVQKRGPFYWSIDGRCVPRSRADTGISGDRIAPEEYVETIKQVLSLGHAFSRSALITETRATLGFNRTGPVLEEAIGTVIDALLLQGTLGEGSSGMMLRKSPGPVVAS